jgi:hypothetical protein
MYARTLYFRWDTFFKKPMTHEQKGERFFADFSTTTEEESKETAADMHTMTRAIAEEKT